MSYSVVKHIDARGLNCPIPILRINQALLHLNSGDVISVQANDSGSIKDIETYCRQTGHDLLDSYEVNEVFEYIIQKNDMHQKKTAKQQEVKKTYIPQYKNSC